MGAGRWVVCTGLTTEPVDVDSAAVVIADNRQLATASHTSDAMNRAYSKGVNVVGNVLE
jgi:hypothetical protein